MPRIIVLVSAKHKYGVSEEEVNFIFSELLSIVKELTNSKELNPIEVNEFFFVPKSKNTHNEFLISCLNWYCRNLHFSELLNHNKIRIIDCKHPVQLLLEKDVIVPLDSFITNHKNKESTSLKVGKFVTIQQETPLNKEHEILVAQIESLLSEDTHPIAEDKGQELQENTNAISDILCLPFLSQTYDVLESGIAKSAYILFYFLLFGFIILPIVMPIANTIRQNYVPQ